METTSYKPPNAPTGRRTKTLDQDYFKGMYANEADPWRFATSPYERDKYATTLAALPRDYPSTAANYSAQRCALVKSLGLGNQRRNAAAKAAAVDETTAEAPKSRGRKKAAEPATAPAEKPARARKSRKAAAE